MADLYFQGFDATFGAELWKTTANGITTRVTDIAPGAGSSAPRILGVHNGELYFSAFSTPGPPPPTLIVADPAPCAT